MTFIRRSNTYHSYLVHILEPVWVLAFVLNDLLSMCPALYPRIPYLFNKSKFCSSLKLTIYPKYTFSNTHTAARNAGELTGCLDVHCLLKCFIGQCMQHWMPSAMKPKKQLSHNLQGAICPWSCYYVPAKCQNLPYKIVPVIWLERDS